MSMDRRSLIDIVEEVQNATCDLQLVMNGEPPALTHADGRTPCRGVVAKEGTLNWRVQLVAPLGIQEINEHTAFDR